MSLIKRGCYGFRTPMAQAPRIGSAPSAHIFSPKQDDLQRVLAHNIRGEYPLEWLQVGDVRDLSMLSEGDPDDIELPLEACVRSVAVNSTAPHALFLGAGASVTSGIPTAEACMWQWKRAIFLTHHVALRDQCDDLSLPSVRQRIQNWLDAEGIFPPVGSPEEYSFFAEYCYPIGEDRRQFFQRLSQGKQPYVGYQVLALLAQAGVVRSVWTTNFDGLAAKAAAEVGLTPIEVGLDSIQRAIRQPHERELLCVALHGDYRYDALKNTSRELQEQDVRLREALTAQLRDSTLIVSGFSGRDRSVMEALSDAYSRPGAGRLYWCGREEHTPIEVEELIAQARANRRIAHFVTTHGFDDLLVRLGTHALAGDLRTRAQALFSAHQSDARASAPGFSLPQSIANGVIRSNAFPVECPREVLQFESSLVAGSGSWARLRERVEGRTLVVGLLRGKVLAVGLREEIRGAFGSTLTSEISPVPLDERELASTDGVVVSLLTEALVCAVALARGLATDAKRTIWLNDTVEVRRVHGQACEVHDAARLYLRRYGGKQYLIVMPTIKGMSHGGGDLPEETERELRRQVLTRQYNREFSQALNMWARRLFGRDPATFEFPPSADSGFRFTVSPVPVLCQTTDPQIRGGRLSPTIQRHVAYTGAVLPEPQLIFSNEQGDGLVRDTHPIRGILRNQPYDFPFTRSGLGTEVRLGVVCPQADARRLTDFLHLLLHRRQPDSKQEYLLEYPGFPSAFGLPLDVPLIGTGAWADCQEPPVTADQVTGARELRHRITSAIAAAAAAASPSPILVYVPERWHKWERYATEDERFDLHDYVKAFCVQRGLPTQFIRESTLTKPNRCEVLWWLALSLYVKSLRTPWVLEGLDRDTAFVGIGYGVDEAAAKGSQIILGCSHLFGANGQSLSYRLTKLENPTWRHKNPHMSREDARRTGETVRQLFYESMLRLPARVVVHKRTPFLPSEQEGLLEGLTGVGEVEMLEVNVDPAMRFVAASLSADSGVETDGFPVRRGTVLVLDRRRALAWVHGTTDAVNPTRKYYQGKSRIPAPLVVIRHHGHSELRTIIREILGLSKMNWNTFDMYTKEPATIASSAAIARIGSLLDRFGPYSYDYRLFI